MEYNNSFLVKRVFSSFVMVSILSAVAATIGMLVDNIIVGQYLGSDALGAMGIISPISLVFSACGNICAGGGTAKAAQAIGKGDSRQVSNVFTITIIFALIVGVIMTVLGLVFTPQIAMVLGAKQSLMDLSVEYLRGYFLGAVPTILMTALMGFVKIDGSQNLPLLSVAVMTAVNIVLDLLMVLVFHQGMFGMALATTISYVLAVLVGCIHFTRRYNTLKLVRPVDFGKELFSMVGTGAPTALNRICDTIKIMILNNVLVTAVGVAAVTAMNIRTQTNSLIGALILGIGQAVIPVCGVFYGEEDRSALRDTVKEALKLGMGMTVAAAVILFFIPSVFSMFLGVTEETTVQMANMAIRLFAVSMPVRLVNTLLMNYYQSTKQTGLATVICVLQAFVYTVLTALILVQPMGSNGIWLAFLLGEILTLVTAIIIVGIKIGRVPKSVDDFLLLARDFGGKPEERLVLTVGNDMEQVLELSRQIYRFGESRNINKETMDMISLCIEEMAGNVVRHAFSPGERKWFDILLVDKQERLILHLRDNGKVFNPVTFLNELQPEEREKYIGIRLVQALTESFEYRRSVGLNNLILTIHKKQGA